MINIVGGPAPREDIGPQPEGGTEVSPETEPSSQADTQNEGMENQGIIISIPEKLQDDLNSYIDNKIKFLEDESKKRQEIIDFLSKIQTDASDPRIRSYFIEHLGFSKKTLDNAGQNISSYSNDKLRTTATLLRWGMIQRIVNNEEFQPQEQGEFQRQVNIIGRNSPEINDMNISGQRSSVLINFIDQRIAHKSQQIEKRDQKRLNPKSEYEKIINQTMEKVRQETSHTDENRIRKLALDRLKKQKIFPPSFYKRSVGVGIEKIRQKTKGLSTKEAFEREKSQLIKWRESLMKRGVQPLGNSEIDFGN